MTAQVCTICNRDSPLISSGLGVCLSCIQNNSTEALVVTQEQHTESRSTFDLPSSAPDSPDGIRCGLCVQNCSIAEGGFGYCGMRSVEGGRLIHHAGSPSRGLLNWYRDPLPTNCVADWVCSGHTRWGYHNLAAFYGSCTLDCLFCQNWHYRQTNPLQDRQGGIQAMSAGDLAACVNERTYCVCFFGGDPASQMPHSLATAAKLAPSGMRICWETAGTMHPRFLKRAMNYSITTGGCVKFDLKAYDDNLHKALTGATNSRTMENFHRAAEMSLATNDPPALIASTLLVPGYVDEMEIGRIARFIAELNPEIPYSILAFHPAYRMSDLPRTSKDHAQRALEAARDAGLNRVHIGNLHLLSSSY
ncbi:MAG: radical SAM protein [Anaerolineales bacterium]|nr:MAG: radical SAM protein [Anaerolineales bacterium]